MKRVDEIQKFCDLCSQHAAVLGHGYRRANALNEKITSLYGAIISVHGIDEMLQLALKTKEQPAAIWACILLYEKEQLNSAKRKLIIKRMRSLENTESLLGAMVDAFLMDHDE